MDVKVLECLAFQVTFLPLSGPRHPNCVLLVSYFLLLNLPFLIKLHIFRQFLRKMSCLDKHQCISRHPGSNWQSLPTLVPELNFIIFNALKYIKPSFGNLQVKGKEISYLYKNIFVGSFSQSLNVCFWSSHSLYFLMSVMVYRKYSDHKKSKLTLQLKCPFFGPMNSKKVVIKMYAVRWKKTR